MNERFLRNASIINQDQINHPVVIIGVGAIGSHLAEMLVKMGVQDIHLIDFDEVDEVNLGVQGFYEGDVGKSKTDAVRGRLLAINQNVDVKIHTMRYEDVKDIPEGAVIFSCVDSMPVRRKIFKDFRSKPWEAFFDGRMAAESLRVFCIPRDPVAINLYQESLFPSHQAHREACTAKATIYCASIAAAMLCAQYKQWAMNQYPEYHLQFDILSFDIFR